MPPRPTLEALGLTHASFKSCKCMQAYDRLGNYGVKARLQTLWRDAHSILSGADKQVQKQNTFHTKKKPKPCTPAQTDAKTDAAASEDALASSHMTNVSEQPSDFVSAQQQAAFAVCNSYMDLFLPNQPYPIRQVLSKAIPRWCACLLLLDCFCLSS